MATRQYIGARYVIKVYQNSQTAGSAEWEADTSYEPLTMVTYQNSSYLSKKSVPATVGNPATNTAYWVITGAYNGQIATLQSQINSIKEIVGTPEQYGAVGDGVTDATTAFQNCVNNADIVVLRGTYAISNTITVPKGVKIYGDGIGKIRATAQIEILSLNGDNVVDGVNFTDNVTVGTTIGSLVYGSDISNIVVTNCKFKTIGNGHCVLFEHCNHIVIEHNSIEDYSFSGIMLMATCKNASIQFNYVKNARYTGAQHSYPICFSAYDLVEYGPAENIKVNYNTVISLSSHWEGIDSHASKNYEIRGNRIEGTLSGIMCGNKPTSITIDYPEVNSNAVIADNYISASSTDSDEYPYGITVSSPTGGYSLKNVKIDNNNITVNSANTQATSICSAISVRINGGKENVEITNNTIHTSNRHGISVDYGPVINMKISGNHFENMTSSSSHYALYLNLSSYDDIVVENNSIVSGLNNIRFLYGPSNAPIGNRLIDYKNNDSKELTFANTKYITTPATTLNVDTKAIGEAGQFIPCTATGTVAGWLCLSAGNWLEISGTAV